MTFAEGIRARLRQAAEASRRHDGRWIGCFLAMVVSAGAATVIDAAAAEVRQGQRLAEKVATVTPAAQRMANPRPVVLVWEGADVDGDGADDFVNPTGGNMRGFDAFGHGHFGASRDGGTRDHAGVDYRAEANQPVKAPISGYVTKIGTAYASSPEYKYVEIRNPALRYEARVFYVDPDVSVGESVHLGDVIGTVRSLKLKYGDAMTDHVHLELSGPNGAKFDATQVLHARVEVADNAG